MIALVRAELLKIRSTRMWMGMLALTVGYTLFNLVFYLALAGVELNGEAAALPPVTDENTLQMIYAVGTGSVLFMMILGIMGITSEYRFQTITQTFLVTPRRGRVLAAKLLSYLVVGLVFGVVTVVLTVAVAQAGLAIRGGPATLLDHEIPMILLGTVAAFGLYALVGLGLGALVRNQIAAIIVAIIWVLLVEQLVTVIVPVVGQWLPMGAVRSLTSMDGPMFSGTGSLDTLPPWGGFLLLLFYGVLFAAIAAFTTTRRDVT
ncbi:ABC transporter permease [Actinomadura flavalba]|uniref:ABC transporter permease n=1 Tax=Actinomadura flavalba TaxID=1120938 RepID=UPI000375FB2F|nr:ABC transporter permease [Actinomadura flavalba]